MKIVLTKNAKNNLSLILKYLENNWSIFHRKKFVKKLDNMLEIISEHPYLCVESKQFPGIRQCTLTKQNSFYYKILNDSIVILTITDNRKNPDSIKDQLSDH